MDENVPTDDTTHQAELPCVAYSSSNFMINRGSRHLFEITLRTRCSLGSISLRSTRPSPRCCKAHLTLHEADRLLTCVQAVAGPGSTSVESSKQTHRAFRFGSP